MFMSNMGVLLFLRRETTPKENTKNKLNFLNMEIATNYEGVNLV